MSAAIREPFLLCGVICG